MMTTMIDRDYYCSKKFTYLKVDLERKTIYNCHAATPHRIDFEWLDNNPGQLFNTPVSITEREMMLRNERNPSCEQNCWHAEDYNGQSPRLTQQGFIKIKSEVRTTPKELDLTLGRDCNLTCSYCCKEFSSSWANDLINNGDYNITNVDDRYKVVALDKVLKKVNQFDRFASKDAQRIYQEIDHWIEGVEFLIITGGEPLLNNQLIELMSKATNAKLIDIYTGLGLSNSRFDKITDELAKIKNLRIILSCENIGKMLEFNRYGIDWNSYQYKVELLKKKNINFIFNATLTNITLFGFDDFIKWAGDYENSFLNFAYTPRFLAPYVLDEDSKSEIISKVTSTKLPKHYVEQITRSMDKTPEDIQIQNCREFLLEFTNRRKDLNLNIFPVSFIKWLGIENVV